MRFSTADEVKLDAANMNRNQSIIFVKYQENKGAVIVSFDISERGKIVLHKTFFNKIKVGRFKNLPTITKPLEGGISSISPKANAVILLIGTNDSKTKNIVWTSKSEPRAIERNLAYSAFESRPLPSAIFDRIDITARRN